MSHNDLTFALFGLSLLSAILAGIFFVIFGEVTVRKLRKNAETKDWLGMEFVSGGNIVSVAQILAWPRFLTRRSGTFGLMPNAELMFSHTTKLDRFLGRVFYWSMMATFVTGIIWAIVVS